MQRTTHEAASSDGRQTMQTAALARRIGYKPASIRTHVSRNGNFQGITPKRLPNGRLLWPADAVERLLSGEVVK